MDNSPAAFPIHFDDRPGSYAAEPGMSLRDWFAGQALAGPVAVFCQLSAERGDDVCEHRAARMAYRCADAMLAARARTDTGEG